MSQQSAFPNLESPIPTPGSTDIVLAFSGGLDTSFCVPWLQERGWAVPTLFADTGGVVAEQLAAIQAHAAERADGSPVTNHLGSETGRGRRCPYGSIFVG